MKEIQIQLFNDHFQNYKVYGIPKAQLVVADIPYNIGINAYASNPCSKMLTKEHKETGKSPCMVVFCAFEQLPMVIQSAKQYGFNHYIPLVFIKNYSPQVLKANMKIVGATEYGLLLYREKLPKFNNNGQMIYNWFAIKKDSSVPKLHPTQKPIPLLKELIRLFTDPGDVVIDPVAGSGTTLKAAAELNRHAYGFEIKKDMYKKAKEVMLANIQQSFI